jgi:hypothetical protein
MKIDQLNQIDGYDPPDSRKLRNDLNVLIKLEAIKENIADNTVEAIEGTLS